MSDDLLEEGAHPPCDFLRTKRGYGDEVSSVEPAWEEGLLGTDCFWCLRTMLPWGPDQLPATASDCGRLRGCYQSPDGDFARLQRA